MATNRKSRAAATRPPDKPARPSVDAAQASHNPPIVVPFRPQAAAAQRDLRIELGRCRMARGAADTLAPGSVVELQQPADEPLDIVADGRLVARGQVIVLDGKFCVRLTELVAAEQVA